MSSALGAVLGRSWGALGTLLGALEAFLGALGALLRRSWAVLGRSGALLGRSWALLGRFRSALGRLSELSGGFSECAERSCVDFVRFMVDLWLPKRLQQAPHEALKGSKKLPRGPKRLADASQDRLGSEIVEETLKNLTFDY